MKKFIRKQQIVEAEQFFVDKLPWPKGVIEANGKYYYNSGNGYSLYLIKDGDWVVIGGPYENWHTMSQDAIKREYDEYWG